ncbi:MAG: hypothetical protein KC619_28670 [Myxococcales bacterium]|nr:hypothetical protein [Myxococcales bacterium]
MARGERPGGARRGTDALGLWAVLGVVALFFGLLVVLAMRGCDDDPGVVSPGPPPASLDARHAFARLGDRDAIGSWPQRTIELHDRGYQRHTSDPPRELPFEAETTPLDGLCGVVQVQPGETSRIDAATRGALGLRPGAAEGLVSFAACGAVPFAVTEGIGQATLAYWVMPGLTPEDVAASELPVEVVLGFAEAEHALRADGFRATDRALRAELATGTTTFRLPTPPSGCVAWAVVGLGFAHLSSIHDSVVHEDGRPGRQLVGAISCTDGGTVEATDVDGDGGTLYALPFVRGGGPRVSGGPGAGLTTAGGVRLTTVEDLELPAGE